MGLRAKLIIALLLVFGALGLVIFTTIQARVASSYDRIEFDEAQADLTRLINAFADSVQQIDDALLEWAVWTEMYDFMRSGDARFRASYLSPEGIAQARYAWLGVYDVQGRMFGSIGHDPERRQPLVLPTLEDPANPLARALGAPLAPGAVHCGLIKIEAQLFAMCRRAIVDSRGAGPAHGVIVILKAIGPDFMARIIRQTKLDAQICAPQPQPDQACALCTHPIQASIG
ncbi:CHASE4 domain-containing protein, partial [Uliginosibacterium flavum]